MTTSHCDGQSSLPMFPRTAETPPPLVCLHCGATQATVRRDRQILSVRLGYPADCVCCYCETGNACPRCLGENLVAKYLQRRLTVVPLWNTSELAVQVATRRVS
jgi:hypothetical protein